MAVYLVWGGGLWALALFVVVATRATYRLGFRRGATDMQARMTGQAKAGASNPDDWFERT